MDKGIKILQRHLDKIEKANNQILDKTLAHAFNLKRTKLSDISYKRIAVFEILIHKDTNNFPEAKQKLLTKIADLHTQFPFITLCFDSFQNEKPLQQPQHARMLPSQNENRLILQVNWADYIRSINKKDSVGTVRLPENAVSGMFQEMKRTNYTVLQEAINMILLTAKSRIIDDKSETSVKLADNTMIYEVTRNHYSHIAQQIMKSYNGMIEIFHTSESTVGIRVHWNIYLTKLAAQEREQINLLPDYNQSTSKLVNPEYFVPRRRHRRRRTHRDTNLIANDLSSDGSESALHTSDPALIDVKIESVPLSSSLPPDYHRPVIPQIQLSQPVQQSLSQPIQQTQFRSIQQIQQAQFQSIPQVAQAPQDPVIYSRLPITETLYPPLDIQTQLFLAPSPPDVGPHNHTQTQRYAVTI